MTDIPTMDNGLVLYNRDLSHEKGIVKNGGISITKTPEHY